MFDRFSVMLRDRIGWELYLKPFIFKKLPSGTCWAATLGSLCVLLFGLLAVTGIFLAMYYNPSPDKAYQSIDYIMQDVPMGSILRGLHHWGGGAMVLVVFLHLLTSFFSGSYKAPRELTWISGACLFVITLGLGFTGYLLPWDMKAYWATVVGSSIPKGIPAVGDFVARSIIGGDTISGFTLTRFYAIHTLLLPGLLAAFTVFHIYLVRIHGIAESNDNAACEKEEKPNRFYPEHALRSITVFSVVCIALVGLSIFGKIPREAIAGTIMESYLPRPEWYYMWLCQLLTYFSGPWEEIATLAIFAIGGILLFSMPFLGRTKMSGLQNRPLCMASGVTAIMGIVYLSIIAYADIKPYGDVIPIPDRQLTAVEQRGLSVYIERECAYCHQIHGMGGRRTGPDLANMTAKGRNLDYLVKFVNNPQAVSSMSIMPKYGLNESDLRSLAEFMLALDFKKYPLKIMKSEAITKSHQVTQSLISTGRVGPLNKGHLPKEAQIR
jgi:quinol-cytochrome oxidoreductase complex cytochrome b subunit